MVKIGFGAILGATDFLTIQKCLVFEHITCFLCRELVDGLTFSRDIASHRFLE